MIMSCRESGYEDYFTPFYYSDAVVVVGVGSGDFLFHLLFFYGKISFTLFPDDHIQYYVLWWNKLV